MACVAFGRTNGDACLQMAADVNHLCSLRCEESCVLTCTQRLGKNVEQMEGQTFRVEDVVEFGNHIGIIGLGGGVNRNHTRGIANTENELTRYLPMDIAGEGSEILDILHMGIVVEYALIEVADAPAERNVVVEELAEFSSSLAGIGVAPSAERHENLLVLIESHIAVHHGREADTGEGFDFAVVLLLNILAEVGIAVLQSLPDILDSVGPQTVNELVFPLVRALCYRLVLLVDEYSLDAG